MSISNILSENGYKIFCGELDSKTQVITPTLRATAGGDAKDVSKLSTTGGLGPLTDNALIVADGAGAIESSLIITTDAGAIDVPENQGYSVNSQSMAYQSAGDSKYYLEGDIIQAAEKIQTPLIESTADGADINIDSTGNGGRVNIITADNTGFTVRTDARDKWSQLITNSLSQRGLLFGTNDFNGGEDFNAIGANTLTGFTPTGWDLLSLQPNASADARLSVGAVGRSEITSSGQRMYVKDGIATDGTYKIMTSATNYQEITGGGTGTYTHTLQDRTGTIAHKSDIVLAEFTNGITGFDFATTTELAGGLGRNLSRVIIMHEFDAGTDGQFVIADADSGNTIATVNITGAGGVQMAETATITNLPTGSNSILYLATGTRTAGAGSAVVFSIRLIG